MCFVVVNRGEVVVDCVVNRGVLHGVFRGRKTCHFLCEFFKKKPSGSGPARRRPKKDIFAANVGSKRIETPDSSRALFQLDPRISAPQVALRCVSMMFDILHFRNEVLHMQSTISIARCGRSK